MARRELYRLGHARQATSTRAAYADPFWYLRKGELSRRCSDCRVYCGLVVALSGRRALYPQQVPEKAQIHAGRSVDDGVFDFLQLSDLAR